MENWKFYKNDREKEASHPILRSEDLHLFLFRILSIRIKAKLMKPRSYFLFFLSKVLLICVSVTGVTTSRGFADLQITEFMYHPRFLGDPTDVDAEFIELTNIGGEIINLNLVRFTKGADFTFPNMELAPGAYTVVVKDPIVFARRYPDFDGVIAGQFEGTLDNNGEKIRLRRHRRDHRGVHIQRWLVQYY